VLDVAAPEQDLAFLDARGVRRNGPMTEIVVDVVDIPAARPDCRRRVSTLERSPSFAWFGAITAGVLLILSLAANPAGAGTGTTPLAKASRYPFAGYITSPTSITSAAATVTLPSVTCTRKTTAITATAIVYNSTGAKFSGAEVYLGCSGKQGVLRALTDIDNVFTVPTVTMNPGDTVSLSATCGASGISVTIDDVTTGSVGTNSSSTPESCTQAEIGDDGASKNGSTVVPLPTFGALDFTGAMVNGAALGALTPSIANYSEGKKNVITTGALTSGGTAFTTTQGP